MANAGTLESDFKDARSGDNAAFSRLHTLLQPQVTRFAERLLSNFTKAEDIAQGAFLSLYLNMERVQSPEAVKTYLYRIVRNLCYDELRRLGRFEHVPHDESLDTPVYPTNAGCEDLPDEVVASLRLYEKVGKAIDRLPEHQRQTMILFFHEDLRYREIAEVLSVEIGTVKSRIHLARKRLKADLGPQFLEEIGLKTP